MAKIIETTVLKPHMAPNGQIVQLGQRIRLDETRYRALVRKGYVAREGADSDDEGQQEANSSSTKEGITSGDFKPRRTPVVKKTGDGE